MSSRLVVRQGGVGIGAQHLVRVRVRPPSAGRQPHRHVENRRIANRLPRLPAPRERERADRVLSGAAGHGRPDRVRRPEHGRHVDGRRGPGGDARRRGGVVLEHPGSHRSRRDPGAMAADLRVRPPVVAPRTGSPTACTRSRGRARPSRTSAPEWTRCVDAGRTGRRTGPPRVPRATRRSTTRLPPGAARRRWRG